MLAEWNGCPTLSSALSAVSRPWSARSSGLRLDYPRANTLIWMHLGGPPVICAGYLKSIGIDRKQRDITDPLDAYLEQQYGHKDAPDA